MSGGVAYVLDEHQLFDTLCNLDMVDLESIWQEEDERTLHDLIGRHYALDRQPAGRADPRTTGRRWPGKFVKVMPIDYRKALERLRGRRPSRRSDAGHRRSVPGGRHARRCSVSG